VALAVWTTEFAARHPLAIIPPIIFHFTQLYGDGFLAKYWAPPEAAEAAPSAQPPSQQKA